MPILIRSPSRADLSQGDVLKDIVFSYTGDDHKAKTYPNSLALVITRDCGVEHGGKTVVARIQSGAAQLPRRDSENITAEKHFESIRRLFDHLREGTGRPDTFYLGTLPDQLDRLAAHLDELCTLRIPTDRVEWITRHRVATLADSFKRSLPVRLFGAYAQVGHDDVEWLSTPDLEALVAAGREHSSELNAAVSRCKYELEQGHAAKPDGSHPALEKSLAEATAKVDKFTAVLGPYLEVLKARAT